MGTNLQFPLIIDYQGLGLFHMEVGPNTFYVHLVIRKDENGVEEPAVVLTVDQTDLGHKFQAAARGRLISSWSVVEMFGQLENVNEGLKDK